MSTDRLYELVTRMGRLLHASERDDLPPVQWHALLYLDRCNGYSDRPGAVTEFLGVTKGTSSQTLRVLEEKGFLTKHQDGRDRRIVRLKLTAKGRRAVRRDVPPRVWSRAVERLGEAEQARLEALMTELLRGMQRENGSRSFGVCGTCRHFQEQSDTAFRCGLTGDVLRLRESEKLCREHEWDPAAAGA